jgi:uncharacterized protein with PQ loop repeat
MCRRPIFIANTLLQISVIKRKDSSSINLYNALATLLCASLWFTYGLLSADIFIMLPNVFGLVFSTWTLHSYFKYFKGKPKQ